jgi:hypothetical protein
MKMLHPKCALTARGLANRSGISTGAKAQEIECKPVAFPEEPEIRVAAGLGVAQGARGVWWKWLGRAARRVRRRRPTRSRMSAT